jgi:hypothetical protein
MMPLTARLEAAEYMNASVKNADDGDLIELEHSSSNTPMGKGHRKKSTFHVLE